MSDAKGIRIPGDWHDGAIPPNVAVGEKAHVETSHSFSLFRSEEPDAMRLGRGCTVYLGTMFDTGRHGRITIGECAMLNSVWFVCDAAIEIGDYALISWNVVFMDSYRVPLDPAARREHLREISASPSRRPTWDRDAKPIRIGRNVWIGFDSCILPGVTIGDGAVIGARSVVAADVPPYTIAAGNPARVIRPLANDEIS